MPRYNTEQNFWERVEISDPNSCWLWLGSLNKAGYGQFRWNGKQMGSHCLAWIFTNGEISQGMQVLHDPVNCHSKACCNPNHLRLGSCADNFHDSDYAKINWDIIHEIRKRYVYKGKDNIPSLAKEFGLSESYVYKIVANETWIE